MMLKDLHSHLPAEGCAVLHGVVKMQSRQNARPVHLLEPIRRTVEGVRVDAVAECRLVVHHNVNFTRPEKVLHQA